MSVLLPRAEALPPNTSRALPGLLIYMWIGCAIATCVVATRLYTRLVLVKKAGWDDLFIAIAYVFALLLYSSTTVQVMHNYGRHIEYVSDADLVLLLKLDIVSNIAGITSLCLARTSIGLFLIRLVMPIRKLAIPVYIGLAINTVQAVCLIIWVGIHCVPVNKTWDPTVPGWCIGAVKYTIVERFLATLNATVDLLFATYPVFIMRRLHMDNKFRLAVYLLLSCGLLAAVASIGRIVASNLTVADITWDLITLTYWALSETTGVLILACMPAFHSLILYIGRTDAWQRVSTRMTSRMGVSKMGSKTGKSAGHSRGSSENDDPATSYSRSRKDLNSSDQDIHVHKHVYIELTDPAPHGEPTAQQLATGEHLFSKPTHDDSRMA